MKIARAKGTDIIINDYFLLLILAYGMLGALFQVILIFTLVLIHETAHILIARLGGLRVKEIELFPFGGVARLEGLLEIDPTLETKVALAGPLSNFFMLGVGVFLHNNFNWQGQYYLLFQNANLTMGIFNLLPALPLDGGRVLRAYWARKSGLPEATWKTALWGRYCAVFLGLAGAVGVYYRYNDLNVVIIAAFIYFAASKYEESTIYVFLRYLLRKNQELAKQGVLPLKALAVTSKTMLKEVFPKFSPGNYHLILVLDREGQIRGQVTEHQMIETLFRYGPSYRFEKLI